MSLSEAQRIAELRAILSGGEPAGVRTGIGDDAAVLDSPRAPLVWSVDVQVEGVHFRRNWLDFGDLGYRATMAAASDLAAMGASPLGVLSALVLPQDLDDEALFSIARGQREAADALGTAIVGGNLARGSELSITTTVLGESAEPITRCGARVGDAIWLCGDVGLAAAGLAMLERGLAPRSEVEASALRAWRRPAAQIEAGVRARSLATAAIDVSDGLAEDLGRVAQGSGVRAIIDERAFVGPALAEVAMTLGLDPQALALAGGEDYALVVIAPARALLFGFTRIGGCEPAREGASPVALVLPDGSTRDVTARGFDHFS